MIELKYKRNGDYLIPDLAPMEKDNRPLGKYGRMRKSFLQEHKPLLWNELLLTGQLDSHLRGINQTAENRFAQMMTELTQANGITETLKAKNQMEWVRQMNSLKAQVEEILMTELVFN